MLKNDLYLVPQIHLMHSIVKFCFVRRVNFLIVMHLQSLSIKLLNYEGELTLLIAHLQYLRHILVCHRTGETLTSNVQKQQQFVKCHTCMDNKIVVVNTDLFYLQEMAGGDCVSKQTWAKTFASARDDQNLLDEFCAFRSDVLHSSDLPQVCTIFGSRNRHSLTRTRF